MQGSLGKRSLGAALAAMAGISACAGLMGIEDPVLDPGVAGPGTSGGTSGSSGTSGGDGGTGARRPCNDDTGCSNPTPHCAAGRCACSASPDSCPSGTYCLPSGDCGPGCKANADCRALGTVAPFCEPSRHQCVQCLDATTCGAKKCSPAGDCVDSCSTEGAPCPGGNCCGGLCIDTTKDILNCNGCNVRCGATNGSPSCVGGNCQWTCNPGYDHCTTGNTGCETRLDTPTQCGRCGNDCTVTVKNATPICAADGTCSYSSCDPWFMNTTSTKANGCETPCGDTFRGPPCPGNQCKPPLAYNGAQGDCR